MAGQAEVDAIPDAGEFGMVIDAFGMRRDAREEGKGHCEIVEAIGAKQCLAIIVEAPAWGCSNVHAAS